MPQDKKNQNQTETIKLHPAEMKLIMYIRNLRNGTIMELKVADGLPVSVERAKEKERFV